MKSILKNIPTWLPVSMLIALALICLVLLWNVSSTTSLGEPDFIAYWSATYLLQSGQNPYDPALIQSVENAQTQRVFGNALMVWNPPPLFVFLLPLVWLSFSMAKFVWLIINLTILVGGSLMLARLYLPAGNNKIVAIYLLLALTLPQVVTGIVMGQVTFLVFFGLAACMMLIKKDQWFWAGASLILTTVKPHMVVLSLIYLLTYMAQRRQYKGWIGLIAVGMAFLVILFAFCPRWVYFLLGEMTIAPVHWIPTTIGGLLSYLGLTEVARYMIILLLPLPFILAKYQATIKMELAVALLTLITVPTTFFGWSFDQTILLIPIAQVFSWMALSKHKTINIYIVVAILASIVVTYLQRVYSLDDVYYVWIPLFWWIIFGLSWKFFQPKINLKLEHLNQ
jgi:hypothetical protein